MFLREFDYDLPEDLIASSPLKNRDQSRLLVCKRGEESCEERSFSHLVSLLGPGDILVLNDTRVLKARFWAFRESGGEIEILLISPLADGCWEALIRGVKRLKPGEKLHIQQTWFVTYLGMASDGLYKIRFETPDEVGTLLEQVGQIPLPPYMTVDKKKANMFESNYQTVFAKHAGAVAAPTAGLHFTEEMLNTCLSKGVQIEYVTLHVGYGTFKPVTVDRVEDHVIHKETYFVSEETATRLNAARGKKRIIAVGTTVVRTLESAFDGTSLRAGEGCSQLYIYPGYQFGMVDAMITNFHLPKSSLLLLVGAFMGLSPLWHAYAYAIKHRFRFFSFGDAMFIQ